MQAPLLVLPASRASGFPGPQNGVLLLHLACLLWSPKGSSATTGRPLPSLSHQHTQPACNSSHNRRRSRHHDLDTGFPSSWKGVWESQGLIASNWVQNQGR